MQSKVCEIAGLDEPHAYDPDWSLIRRGWCLGDSSFRDRLLDTIEKVREGMKASSLAGDEIRCHNTRQAERLLEVGMTALGLTNTSLDETRKSAMEKQVLAWLLRSHTTVTNEWVSCQLSCGHPDGVSRFVKTVGTSKDKTVVKLKKRVLKALADV